MITFCMGRGALPSFRHRVSRVPSVPGRRAGKKLRGFTLVELLVVLAIVGLLASLLLPAISRAKAKAHSAVCQHNLKQIGLALRLYVEDYQAYPFHVWFGVESTGRSSSMATYLSWYECLYPYTVVTWTGPLFRCPSYRGYTSPLTVMPSGSWRPEQGSYGHNKHGVSQEDYSKFPYLGLGPEGDSSSDSLPPVYESKVLVPSDMLAVGDAPLFRFQKEKNLPDFYIAGDGRIFPWTPGPNTSRLDYHQGHPNFVFCDDHVESIKLDKLNEPTPEARRRWNNDHEPHPERWR